MIAGLSIKNMVTKADFCYIIKNGQRVEALKREDFENLVARAVDELPQEFLARLQNVAVVVRDWPTTEQAAKAGLKPGHTLLGLYEGIPRTKRDQRYSLVPPDKITIFQGPVEAICHHDADIAPMIQKVVKHEIAHHFGISDARLRELGD
jgi:predicted Zn-dependent protease with MMP-like domain